MSAFKRVEREGNGGMRTSCSTVRRCAVSPYELRLSPSTTLPLGS